MTNFNWYVVYTKPRSELKVANLLARKHIKNYCPLHITDNPLPESKKVVLEPLFTSFVFVYIQDSEIGQLLKIPGIANYLYWRDKPVKVNEEEINALVKLSKEYSNLKLEKYLIDPAKRDAAEQRMFVETEPMPAAGESMKVSLPSLGYYVIASPVMV